MSTVHTTIISVMRDIEAIGKEKRNQQQGFNFRGIDDIYNSLHGVMAKHGLFTIPRVVAERTEERQSKSGGINIYRVLSIEFDFFNAEGDKVTAGPFQAEAMDSADKASNKAHSIAHKYCLLQVFMIPTVDMEDPDSDGNTPKTGQEAIDAMKRAQERDKKDLEMFLAALSSNVEPRPNGKTAIVEALKKRNIQSVNDISPEQRRQFYDEVIAASK